MRHKIALALLVLLAVFAVPPAGYFAISDYYQGRFGFHTWINGNYCTGMGVEEVNAELLAQTQVPVIAIIDCNGNREEIDLGDCGYRLDYKESLQQILNGQDPHQWADFLNREREEEAQPVIFVDEKLLREKWESLSFVSEEADRPLGEVKLQWTSGEGYQILDSTRDRFQTEKGFQDLLQAVYSGENQLELTGEKYYSDLPYSQKDQEVFSLYEKIKKFQSNSIVYDMGAEQLKLDGKVLEDFLVKDAEGIPVLDQDGQFQLEEEAALEYLTGLLEEYNTYGKEHSFLSSSGEQVLVPAGNYGTELDMKAELAYFTEVLDRCRDSRNPVQEIHTPSYKRKAFARGRNDIGDTYIEIDMTRQKLYYYVEGECLVETDVVTGNLKNRHGMPAGVFSVYAKQRNRTLRGPGYASFVRYWMPVYKGIGIHDASWRSSFGGEIYKANGSHGCINTPRDKMQIIYESAEIGTPVVILP